VAFLGIVSRPAFRRTAHRAEVEVHTMPLPFASGQAALFGAMGLSALYTPGSGDPVPLRVIRQGGGQTVRLGTVEVALDRVRFHVLRAALPAPEAGATLVVDGATWTVQAVQPVEKDSHGLKWSLDVAWGAPILWRSVAAGSPQTPPSISGALVLAATAPAGATALSLRATSLVGRLIAGDRVTVGGATYAVTNPVAAVGNSLPAVPIAPALATDVAAGAVATLFFARDVGVVAAIAAYQAAESQSGIVAGDVRLILLAAAAAALPEPPKAGDGVLLPGRTTMAAIKAVSTFYSGADLVGYEIQAR